MSPLREELAALCRASGIDIVLAFGSRAREALEMIEGERRSLAPGSSTDELYQICSSQLGDVTEIRDALRNWFDTRPELVDRAL